MTVHRIVPDLLVAAPLVAARLYQDVLGLEVVMDHGWVVTLANPLTGPAGPQLTLLSHDATAPVPPVVSVEVSDVDGAHAAAVACGADVVHPLTHEAWGVRRFFLRDADGHVINVLGHR